MSVTKIEIQKFLLLSTQFPVIDVRSPDEFVHAHFPGAFNLPLFNNDERKVVGTAYKQQSREKAIKIGLQYFGPKMVRMVEEMEQLLEVKYKTKKIGSPSQNNAPSLNNNYPKTVILHCWRGGMRSAGVAWLLDLYGFKVYLLTGGYKTFRQWVHYQFEVPYKFNIIGGYTGSGKTQLLSELQKQGKAIIDLEGLANHKGSSFGSIGMPDQPTQEMFENILALELYSVHNKDVVLRKSVAEVQGKALDNVEIPNEPSLVSPPPTIWIEDESQRIGNLNIPTALWLQMRKASVYFLQIPFEERLNHIIKDYGKGDKDKIINAIIRIKKRLGGLEAKTAINHLLEDNLKECFRVLLHYYDKYYLKGLQSRDEIEKPIAQLGCSHVSPIENSRKLLAAVTIF